jgi:hypothetical protein
MSIVDRALALVGADPIPFALVERSTGGPQYASLMATNSVRASIMGRRFVAAHAADATGYALAVDAFVRIEGERRDAIIVEHAMAGAPTAEVVACPYQRVDGALSFGDPLPYRIRPSALVPLDPNTLDWGVITPDFYAAGDNRAIHVVNHALEVDDTRTVRFLRARARVFDRHLPASPPPTQECTIDIRGQHVPASRQVDLAARLGDVMAKVTFLRDEEDN